ncbi:MAG: hypothetical protein ACYS22_19680, partial [Planctomycetota bacterium]
CDLCGKGPDAFDSGLLRPRAWVSSVCRNRSKPLSGNAPVLAIFKQPLSSELAKELKTRAEGDNPDRSENFPVFLRIAEKAIAPGFDSIF